MHVVHSVEIGGAGYRATFSTSGAALQSLAYEGKPLVETFPAHDISPMSAGIHMAPWPNRVRLGDDWDLPITIHGMARFATFRIASSSETAVTLTTELGPELGWPWPLALDITYRIDAGLIIEINARNLAAEPAPFAYGMHPYLTVGGAPLDDCLIDGAPLAGTTLDSHYKWTGSSTLTAPGGASVCITGSQHFSYLQLFTADPDFSDPYPYTKDPRGRALAVEPMTAPPFALNSGEGLRWLQPNEEVTMWLKIEQSGL